jgi:hypothetical protein
MSKSVATESNAMKSLSSHSENVTEESRLSSARVHEGRVMSMQVEKELGSGNALVANSSAMVSSALAKSSSESHQKSSFSQATYRSEGKII